MSVWYVWKCVSVLRMLSGDGSLELGGVVLGVRKTESALDQNTLFASIRVCSLSRWTVADRRGVASFQLFSNGWLNSVAIWQWLRMIQPVDILNPVVSQTLYPPTFCKATEQCTTVGKVAFTRELYPKASCGELERGREGEKERERYRGVSSERMLSNVTAKPWL